MLETVQSVEDMTLTVTQEIRVNAPLETTFAALVVQLTTANGHPDGTPMPMKLEAWPGGRWFRDLGDGNGHYWGTVQAIKRPTLLEITGPLFMSCPVSNNVQYRLTDEAGATIIRFCHSGFGLIPEIHRTGEMGFTTGWTYIHEQVRLRAERARS